MMRMWRRTRVETCRAADCWGALGREADTAVGMRRPSPRRVEGSTASRWARSTWVWLRISAYTSANPSICPGSGNPPRGAETTSCPAARSSARRSRK